MDAHPDSTGLSRSTGMLIAGVLARANLADSARAVMNRARQGRATEQALLSEAGVLSRLGENDAAVEVLREFLAMTRGASSVTPFSTRKLEPLRDYPGFRALLTARR